MAAKNLRDVLLTRKDRVKLCAMNAIKTNDACKALYELLSANGKLEIKY